MTEALIRLKDQEMFLSLGSFSVAELPDTSTGELLKRWAFTLITRDVNEVMRNIHNDGENRGRMPLLLPLDLAKAFVDDNLQQKV